MAFGPSNRMLVVKKHRFIQLNTMALDSDVTLPDVRAESDSFLSSAVDGRALGTAQDNSGVTVLMTHLPLFRSDDTSCGSLREPWGHVTYEHPSYRYASHVDVLSKELSERLLTTLKPSVVLSGHTHAWCNFTHSAGTQEYTIPAFTWGQRPDPSYGVLDLEGGDAPTMTLCRLPFEPHVFALYGTALLLIAVRWATWAHGAVTRWRARQLDSIHAAKKTP
ncbi:hypothetical protein PINS_up006263 [Pythium insidiosum]|nr:hypothetical protein PINS_up006263 [Pythium insidiosum]